MLAVWLSTAIALCGFET